MKNSNNGNKILLVYTELDEFYIDLEEKNPSSYIPSVNGTLSYIYALV